MKKIFALVALSFFSAPVLAADAGGLFVEPYAFYENGTGTLDFGSFGDQDGDLKGWGAGLRFGGHVADIFFIALDGQFSKPEFTSDSGNFDFDLNSWLAGVTVGLQTPVAGLRVWGSYLPLGILKLDGKGSNDANIKYKDPKIFKVGAGFYVAAISINLEWMSGKYDTLEIDNAGLITGDYDGNAERKSLLLSLSFPLAL
jgi:hypothetical protein